MTPFTLERPATIADAARLGVGGEFIAGGTDMVPLMRDRVRQPARLVDLTGALERRIERRGERLHIDAGVTMEELATDAGVAAAAPLVAQALLESASVQVRNMATIGGNLLQRTRCGYFRDAGTPNCNKRAPGSGCAAIGGENRILAVLGTSETCIATHPSDLAVAFAALDAEILVSGPAGERRLPLARFYRLPEAGPERETELEAGEVIVAVEVTLDAAARRSTYLKVRDRASFEWALLSAAVGLEVEDGRVKVARIAMGGVGTRPWRMAAVEEALRGRTLDRVSIDHASRRASEHARGYGGNDFKILLMPRVLARAIELAGEAA
jgi:xanthine dehydrogenase YagS FAD-binding subunit